MPISTSTVAPPAYRAGLRPMLARCQPSLGAALPLQYLTCLDLLMLWRQACPLTDRSADMAPTSIGRPEVKSDTFHKPFELLHTVIERAEQKSTAVAPCVQIVWLQGSLQRSCRRQQQRYARRQAPASAPTLRPGKVLQPYTRVLLWQSLLTAYPACQSMIGC